MTSHPTDAAYKNRQVSPDLLRKGAGLLAVAGAAALLFLALVMLWLGQASRNVYEQGADALVIRAVLRTDTDNVAAETLAERIRKTVPDAGIEVINEAMGRSLLALQEPWIAQMPDFEVTPLPILLEIRHPDLLTAPAKVLAFVEELEKVPEVDFVAYNETAHDRLVKLAGNSSAIEKHSTRWVFGAIFFAGVALVLTCMLILTPASLISAVLKAVLIWVSAWAIAWLLYRGWESTAVAASEWQRLGSGAHFTAGLLAGVLILAVSLVSWSLRRLLR